VFHPDCIQPWLKVNGSCPVWSVTQNSSCGVLMISRFSLVPDEANEAPSDQAQTQTMQTPSQIPLPASTAASPPPESQRSVPSHSRPSQLGRTDSGNPITSVLQRLWGQSGSTNSLPASPTTENPSRAASSPQTPMGGPSAWLPSYQPGNTLSHSGAASPPLETPRDNMSAAIPADYRERHRRREQQQYQQQQGGNEPL
jgi:E3 ubiquitin-protein ligase RNF115/126